MAAPVIPVAASTSGADLTAAFRECFASMIELGAGLSEAEWASPSLCPGWAAKDALIHVTAAEMVFLHWEDRTQPPLGPINAAIKSLADRSGADVLAAFVDVTTQRAAQLEAMSNADFDTLGWTATGPGPYRRYMEIRVFDHWAHEQDIRVPLGRPGHLSGLGATMSLDEVHMVFGYLVGKRAATPDGDSVTLKVTGAQQRCLHAKVVGRAQVLAELAEPTATVETDFLTAMLLACGRIDPDAPLCDGRVLLGGDLNLAERVARNLSFTL